ncbi:MAG: glycosyltransferase family 2 protein [Candidatus Marinimicrobia bacterium]|nr:glycosyltransferase family 2 protein [Candidatus Neomarinimicrobiota bacterium]
MNQLKSQSSGSNIAPLVSVIVPHFNGIDILDACLNSLLQDPYPALEIIVVDNGSLDGSPDFVAEKFPTVHLVRNTVNRGFAGGCNDGMRHAKGTYFLILNNDTTHQPGWIGELVDVMESAPEIGAVQPKLLSAQQPDHFDYSGGAGGLLDFIGYPFALGRIFSMLEKDKGQYDEIREIFWASGTAFLLRREVVEQVGGFDEDFFAHMEEIDLCWRMQNAGWVVKNAPRAVVWHHSGWTLPPDRYKKKYLNHRNNLIMLIKNYPWRYLALIFPLRVTLEGVAFAFSALIRDWKRMVAIIHAALWIIFHPHTLIRKHMAMKNLRDKSALKQVTQRMYPGSVFFQYFIRRQKRVSDLS